MSICGFVPNPDSAALVVAWVEALADDSEQRVFLCLDSGFDGRTSQAVRETLAKVSDNAPNSTTIDDSKFVPLVLKQLRQTKSRMLVTTFSKLAATDEQTKTVRWLLRAAPCMALGLLYGEHLPSEVKRALIVLTGHQNDRTAVGWPMPCDANCTPR